MSILRNTLSRRQMIRTTLAATVASTLPGTLLAAEKEGGSNAYGPYALGGRMDQHYPFSLPDLPYAGDALEAAIDAQTMGIHHGRHHQGYVNKLNAALEGHSELRGRTLGELVAGWENLPEAVRSGVRNNGGGHLNHSLFWPSLSPSGGGEAEGALGGAIRESFGSFQSFRDQFSSATGGVFGSGWGWLAASPSGSLEIVTTPNQDNPVSKGMTPLLGLDVWEHAYYLRYQNRRADYIQAFWGVVNWDEVGMRFDSL
jgi:Fe-Mn family superoxide dismutase